MRGLKAEPNQRADRGDGDGSAEPHKSGAEPARRRIELPAVPNPALDASPFGATAVVDDELVDFERSRASASVPSADVVAGSAVTRIVDTISNAPLCRSPSPGNSALYARKDAAAVNHRFALLISMGCIYARHIFAPSRVFSSGLLR